MRLAAGLLGLLNLRCSADEAGAAGPQASGSQNGAGGTGSSVIAPGGNGLSPTPGAGASSSGGSAPIVVPPETEVEQSFLAPVVTGKYVFSANPASGRVAVIDADTYQVRLFNAGFGPKFLTAIPGGKAAIVLNELSHDTTLFELSGDEISVSPEALPVHAAANAWATSNNGRFAIAWTRTPDDAVLDPTSGSQNVTVLDLEQSKSTRLSAGFHPTQVTVDAKSERAFVVADDGISVFTLGDAPVLSELIHVSEDPLEEPAARDVSIVPDGDFAVVRIEGSSELRIVDLLADERALFDLGGPIADVDLSSDGKQALAVVPALGEVVLIPVPPSAGEASFEHIKIAGETIASVALSDASELALLYQNGAANSHLTVLDLRPLESRLALRTFDLKGPVSAAFAAPGAQSAIVFQRPITGSGKAGMFSGVPTLEKRSAKIVGTDAAPSSLAFSEDGGFALVTVGNEKTAAHGVYCLKLDTLQEDFIPLASPPFPGATGIVEASGRGFVAQAHPEGRITFVELATATAHTITGFELAARISY